MPLEFASQLNLKKSSSKKKFDEAANEEYI
jgi:hypothetical protein